MGMRSSFSNEYGVSYQEWVNLMLKENGQEPVNKRWNG